MPAQGAYPSYSRPAVPAHGAYPTSISYPSSPNYHGYGGYRPGYPFGRSQAISLENSNGNEVENETLSVRSNVALAGNVNENGNENNVSLYEEQKESDLELEQTVPTSNLFDENGVILYPAVIQAPVEAIPSPTPTYFLPDVNRYQLADGHYNAELIPIKPYQTQILPIHLDEYPFRFVNYRPNHREKRNAEENETVISNTDELNEDVNKDMIVFPSNSSKKTASETNNTLSNIRLDKTLEEYNPPVDIISPDYSMRVTRKDEKTFKSELSQTLSNENQNNPRNESSRISLLAAGLLGAAAGFAVSNTGINSYHIRPQYYGGSTYGVPHFPNPYYHYSPYPTPARPSISRPYYYYRSKSSNNEENETPTPRQSRGENETRSPFIILSTHLEPAQTPNRFPYNQHFYYQQHHTINQQQSKPNTVQPQILLPNRFFYIVDQPFIQNQVQPAAHDSEMKIGQ